ncbi:MAG: hypothetical protein GZ093_10900 [Rhodoferax sp.]|uniref:hypothetical protein n=1 Tax=Rhodoferax sp. TaxID=50421 RepID=UPI0013FFD563|nr:hypothetical protein [Rhodoferax sp.]NDP39240.1 hypothetical protein [Rhodoferax sp.]
MTAVAIDLTRGVFAKTAIGQQEIASRSLGLGPLPRRLLVLIDGKRNGQELAVFTPGQDIEVLLSQLIENGCIEVQAPRQAAPATQPVAPAQPVPGAELASLPPPESRSAKDIEMARNFMTNTINTVFAQNTRLTLLEALLACKTSQDLRRVYLSWVETMSTSAMGTKRLPEFREKLFKVL